MIDKVKQFYSSLEYANICRLDVKSVRGHIKFYADCEFEAGVYVD